MIFGEWLKLAWNDKSTTETVLRYREYYEEMNRIMNSCILYLTELMSRFETVKLGPTSSTADYFTRKVKLIRENLKDQKICFDKIYIRLNVDGTLDFQNIFEWPFTGKLKLETLLEIIYRADRDQLKSHVADLQNPHAENNKKTLHELYSFL